MSRLVVVAPLKDHSSEQARRLLDQGPPFDLASTAFERHQVFVTDKEVVFVFEGPEARDEVQRLVGDPGVWRAAAEWRACLAGRPRFAQDAYSWERAGNSDPGT